LTAVVGKFINDFLHKENAMALNIPVTKHGNAKSPADAFPPGENSPLFGVRGYPLEGSHGSSISCITASEGGFAEVGEVEAGRSPRVNAPGQGNPQTMLGGCWGRILTTNNNMYVEYM